MPPRGVKVSCILLTVPVVNEVVVVVNMADCAMPKRTSLPVSYTHLGFQQLFNVPIAVLVARAFGIHMG